MKLSTLLLLAPALLAAALPAPASDVAAREAEPLEYVKRTGYGIPKREADPEAEPLEYIKRTGYGLPKREESA